MDNNTCNRPHPPDLKVTIHKSHYMSKYHFVNEKNNISYHRTSKLLKNEIIVDFGWRVDIYFDKIKNYDQNKNF